MKNFAWLSIVLAVLVGCGLKTQPQARVDGEVVKPRPYPAPAS